MRLGGVLPDPVNKPMMYRFNNILRQWLHKGQPASRKIRPNISLTNFQFNQRCMLSESIDKPLTGTWAEPGKVHLDIPKLKKENTTVPAGTQSIQCSIRVISARVNELSPGRSYKTSLTFDYHQWPIPAVHLEMPFKVQPGEFTLVIVGLKYIVLRDGEPDEITDLKWLPISIVGAYFEKEA